jgi:hypothetical protein
MVARLGAGEQGRGAEYPWGLWAGDAEAPPGCRTYRGEGGRMGLWDQIIGPRGGYEPVERLARAAADRDGQRSPAVAYQHAPLGAARGTRRSLSTPGATRD